MRLSVKLFVEAVRKVVGKAVSEGVCKAVVEPFNKVVFLGNKSNHITVKLTVI